MVVRKKPYSITIVALLLINVSMPSANAQFTTFPPQQNNDYNQSYNQSYNQPYNNPNQGYGYQQNLPPLQGRVVVAPAGTMLSVATTSGLSSQINRVGDTFSTRLTNDLYIGGNLVLPAGSTLEGQVAEAQSSGRTGKNGTLAMRFTSVVTPDGRRIPISARLATEDGTGILKGGSTAGRIGRGALNTAIGAGLGAALGTALAPAAGGRVGKGAVYGTAIGGGVGLLSNLIKKGKEAEIPSGTQLQIVLDQPLNVQGSSGGYGGYNNYNNNYNNNYGGGYSQQQQYYGGSQPYGNSGY